jgi:hypothetical protein
MNTECVGGRGNKLVDARFLRALDGAERGELERHLVACTSCSERYRRLQLAERVASVGPERAFEEPSPFEIERMAMDLGLVDRPERRWSAFLRSRFLTTALPALAVTAAVSLFVIAPRTLFEDRPVERGEVANGPITVAAYVISANGDIRALAGDPRVHASDYLKLRVGFVDAARSRAAHAVEVRFDGFDRTFDLPNPGELAVSVPDAIALAKLPVGKSRVEIEVIDEAKHPLFETVLDLEVGP